MSKAKPVISYIGIGSNLAGPLQQVKDVIPRLDQIQQCRLIKHSSLYQSEPVSDIPQEDYINAVACIETTLQPFDLLLELQAIEHAFYRNRDSESKWGPRTMDLDIILYGQLHQKDSHLTIPHPQMMNRLFVLKPLKEIAESLYIPTMGSLDYLIELAPAIRMHKLND